MSRAPLRLPLPTPTYDKHQQDVMIRELESSDANNQKKYGNYDITDGDLRLKDPSGVMWKVRVANDGKLYTLSGFSFVLDAILDDVTLSASVQIT